jgi:thioredoxin-dependent peroxiredoxin
VFDAEPGGDAAHRVRGDLPARSVVTVPVGFEAPAFSLPGTDGTGRPDGRAIWSLVDLRPSVVVLVFYPADASPVCTTQLRTYTGDIGQFQEIGAQVLAISPQSVEEHERFARDNGGFAFPLLSDADQEVGRRYGVLGPVGFYRRSVFVVDAEGVIRYAHRSTAGLTFRPTVELVSAVQAAQRPAVR